MRDHHVGHHLGGIDEVGDVVAFEIRLRHCRNGYRHVLQGFILLPGGDDELLDFALHGQGGHRPSPNQKRNKPGSAKPMGHFPLLQIVKRQRLAIDTAASA